MNSKPDFLIDIEKVLKEKAPNSFIPGFFVRYLRKIIHEKEINELLTTYSHQKNVDFLESAVKYFQVNVSIKNRENLPHDDKLYIFVGNHPLGGMDAIMTGSLLGREYDGKIRFMANDMLMFIEPLKEMFIPVNKVVRRARIMFAIKRFFSFRGSSDYLPGREMQPKNQRENSR
jgi:hypothetical protein